MQQNWIQVLELYWLFSLENIFLTYTTDLETGKNTKFSQNCKKKWLMDWNHFRRMTMLILNNQGFRQVQKATNNLMLTIILQT